MEKNGSPKRIHCFVGINNPLSPAWSTQSRAITSRKQKQLGVLLHWDQPGHDSIEKGVDRLVGLCFANDETRFARNVNDIQDMLVSVVYDLGERWIER